MSFWDDHYKNAAPSWSQSYEFWIYNYNASDVVGWSIFKYMDENIFVSKCTRLLVAL
jgi:hypothetical protein